MNFGPIRETWWLVKKNITWGFWRFKKYTKPTEMKRKYELQVEWAQEHIMDKEC